jgi:hypothetical protein
VKYVLAARLVNELVDAADDRQLSRTIARYGRVDLLCLDELGYMKLDRRRRRTALPGTAPCGSPPPPSGAAAAEIRSREQRHKDG